MALSTAQTGFGASLLAQTACVITQLHFVDASSVPEVPRFATVWVVGFHSPAKIAGVDARAVQARRGRLWARRAAP